MAYSLTFRQLEIFSSVAKHQSITSAAEALYLSQPAVSMQIKQMEHLIGMPLIEKVGKKLFLTDAGNTTLEYAIQILQSKEALEETLDSMGGSEKGLITLATPETANQFVTLMLAEFIKLYPGITINLQIHNRQGLLQCIKNNSTDLVIMGQAPDEMELETSAFMKNPLVIIAPPNHPLSGQKKISLKKLMDNEFVVRESGSGTRIAMQRFFDQHKVRLKTSMEMPSNESIKQAVTAGLGLGIVSLHTLQQELALKQVKVLNIEKMPIMRTWYLTHHSKKALSPAMKLFKQFVIANTQVIWIKNYPEIAGKI